MALNSAQLVTLKAAIAAETDPTFAADRAAGATGAMAAFYNGVSTFVVWKSLVTLNQIGDKINGSELAGLTTAEVQRLQTIAQYSTMGVNPSLADRRSFFDNVFSGAGGALTRAALLALWKRFATRGEKLFATGTGIDAAPGLLVLEGSVSNSDIVQALAS